MTIESDLYTVLSAVCPRAFPDVAPTSTQRPYITYQQFGGDVIKYIDPTIPSAKNGYFQVNIWADTRSDAALLMLQAETALITSTAFQASPTSAPVSDYDIDNLIYGSRQDFSVWSDR
jgi:hypothetical protein